MDDEKEEISAPDTSIRGAIRAAIDEVQVDGDDTSNTQVSRADRSERKVSEPKDVKSEADDDNSEKGAKTEKPRDSAGRFNKAADGKEGLDKDIKGDKSVKSEKIEADDKQVSATEKPEVKPATELKPPVSWSKEGKAAWNTLPADVQKSVLKREEEFSSGIKMYSDKAKAYDELDQVIAPYKQQIANFGVTPAQTVGKLFEWMNALGHPNQEYKASAFKLLAESFGFDVNKLAPSQDNAEFDGNTQQPTFDPSLIRQAVQQEIAPIQQTLTQFQRSKEEQDRARAANEISQWAADKPYYEQVRVSMHNLISSGEVPLLPDGNLDLDGAYEKAIWLNPEVRQALQEQAATKAAQEAQEKANREAAQKVAELKRAKSVGVGIKPSAPSMRFNTNGAVKQPAPGAKVSVRDSLKLSMQQLREGE